MNFVRMANIYFVLFELLRTFFLLLLAIATGILSYRQNASNEMFCMPKNKINIFELYRSFCINKQNISIWWIINIASLNINSFVPIAKHFFNRLNKQVTLVLIVNASTGSISRFDIWFRYLWQRTSICFRFFSVGEPDYYYWTKPIYIVFLFEIYMFLRYSCICFLNMKFLNTLHRIYRLFFVSVDDAP